MLRNLLAFGASLAIAACQPTPVSIGNVSEDASSGPIDGSASADGSSEGGTASPLCYSDSDCDGGFCEFQACNADAGGWCRAIPPDCYGFDRYENPVCGCDGVTYWSDCVRRLYGEPLRDDTAPCAGKEAAPCTLNDTSKCRLPSEMYCAVEFPPDLTPPGEPQSAMCGSNHPMSSCWALPPGRCNDPEPQPEYVAPCASGPDATPTGCLQACEAIQNHMAFQPLLDTSVCGDAGSSP